MTPRTATVIAICVLLCAVVFQLFLREPPPPAAPPVVSNTPAAAVETIHPPPATVETQAPQKIPTRPVFKRDFVNPLVQADITDGKTPPQKASDVDADAARDFDKIALMLRDYRTITGENPTGTNAEVMKAIIGGNPRGAILGPPEGQSLNGDGELIDRWGTPYFFHHLTRDLMEIRSAGPDRRMWNEDDVTGD